MFANTRFVFGTPLLDLDFMSSVERGTIFLKSVVFSSSFCFVLKLQ